MPRAISSVGVGRQVKRETALVSYNDLNAQHSGDRVILLVSLRSYDMHLSVTFLVTCSVRQSSVIIFVCYGATQTVRDIFRSNLNFDLATFMLYTCF